MNRYIALILTFAMVFVLSGSAAAPPAVTEASQAAIPGTSVTREESPEPTAAVTAAAETMPAVTAETVNAAASAGDIPPGETTAENTADPVQTVTEETTAPRVTTAAPGTHPSEDEEITDTTVADDTETADNVSVSVFSSELGIEMADLSQGVMTTLYDSSNGLPTSEANVTVQMPNGIIYVGSYCGLIRYDGRDFYRFGTDTGISAVVSLLADSKGRLWIGTNDSGVFLYNEGTFTSYGKDCGLSSLSVRSLAEDNKGNIIVGTMSGMAYIDDTDTMHIIDDPAVNGLYIKELREWGGIVYGMTYDGALFMLEDLKVKASYDKDRLGKRISCIYPDEEVAGYVYLGTVGNEIVRADIKNGLTNVTTIDTEELNGINHISCANGDMWVCANNGIGFIRDNVFRELTGIPMNNSVDHMMADIEGDLWFCSTRQGVLKLCRSRFIAINHNAGLPDAVVNTTCVSGDDLYIGTDSGLVILDRNTYAKRSEMISSMLSDVRIRSIKKDSQNRIWFCTFSEYGLVCLEPSGKITMFDKDGELGSDRVRTLTELSDGSLAVSIGAGVYIIRDMKIAESYTEKDGLGDSEILTICERTDGALLLGSDGDGLYILKDGVISRAVEDMNLSSDVILRIKYDWRREAYWLITSNSIAYMKGDKIKTVSNFPYTNNFDLFCDRSEHIWVLASNGIYVVSAQDMLTNTRNMPYTLYDSKMGLRVNATANSRSFCSDNGFLYIAGSSGVIGVNINEDTTGAKKVRLAVVSVMVDGKEYSVSTGGRINIPENAMRITINALPLTYGLTDPRVCYSLLGLDEQEFTCKKSDMLPISYTNLDGGRYLFTMSLIDDTTGAKTQTISFTIVKKTALYEQTWFGVVAFMCALFILLVIVLFYFKSKTSSLEKEKSQVKELVNQTIAAFAKCIDMKDNYTKGHSFRVAAYTRMIAEKMGGYTEDELQDFYNIALLHDIGKISIPDAILNKPGKLTDEEFEKIKSHAWNGYEVLKEIKVMPELALGAGYHHERLNGTGYPHKLLAEDIPMVAQIIAVADTFDAMYSNRVYRKQLELATVADEIYRCRGSYYNEEVVDAYMKLVEEGAFKNPEENNSTGEEREVDLKDIL